MRPKDKQTNKTTKHAPHIPINSRLGKRGKVSWMLKGE